MQFPGLSYYGDKSLEPSCIHSIYTNIDDAQSEIWRRWNDTRLKKMVTDFLEEDIPLCFQGAPRAVLGRQLATPNFEFFRFIQLANQINLSPVVPEYREDIFHTRNIDKYHWAKLVFYHGVGRKGGIKTSSESIIDINKSQGKRFAQICSSSGCNICDFHHTLLHSIAADCTCEILDISDWFNRKGKSPKLFYNSLLSLFVCYGVLFESFLADKWEKEFNEFIVLPAVENIQRLFGLKPLIVPLYPIDKEYESYWRLYPENLKALVQQMLNGKRNK